MTHAEHSKKAKVSTPCTAQSLTFGGHCLNCGYDPAVHPPVSIVTFTHTHGHRHTVDADPAGIVSRTGYGYDTAHEHEHYHGHNGGHHEVR